MVAAKNSPVNRAHPTRVLGGTS